MNMSREQRQEAQRRSTEVKNRNRLERAAKADIVHRVVDWSERENLSISALKATVTAIQRGTNALNDVPLETALDVLRSAEAARIWHSLMRLELGESTSNTLTASVDPDALAHRLARLRGAESPDSDATPT